jgi:hypothetical protein
LLLNENNIDSIQLQLTKGKKIANINVY